MKKTIKALALTCALSLSLSLFGCADTSWVAKVDGVTITPGIYITFLMSSRSQVLQQAQTATASGTASAAGTSSKDPWSQKIENKDATTWAVDNALKSCKMLAEIEKLSKQKNITLSSTEKSAASSQAQSYNTQYAQYSKNGVSTTSLSRIIEDYSQLSQKLFNSYYGPGGEKAVSDTDLKKYYADNFVRIKHIVLLTSDKSGNPLSTAKANEVKATADKVLALASAKGANFDSLMTQYSEDKNSTTGKLNDPDGYIFSKQTAQSQNFDTTFISTAFSMKVGEVKKIQASYGYDIMYKVKVDENYNYVNTNRAAILQEMKGTEFEKIIENAVDKAKVQRNEAAIKKYSPKNIKDVSTAS